jgi:iron complex transport system ATP-binding protein
MSSILELKGVSFSYSGGPHSGPPSGEGLIEGLDLAVNEADFVALLGANGSGKSTILKLLGGILRPHRGAVDLWGRPISSLQNRDRAKLVSYMPQVLDLNVPFKVRELVEMGLYPYDIRPEMTVSEAVSKVGLGPKSESLIRELSGGERRRAFIAMTLLQGAGILLLDEPLSNLDIRYQMEIIRLLRELNSEGGISIVMALHDINLAFQFDRVVLVKEGRLLAEGGPVEVLTDEMLHTAFETRVRTFTHEGGSYISLGGPQAPTGDS